MATNEPQMFLNYLNRLGVAMNAKFYYKQSAHSLILDMGICDYTCGLISTSIPNDSFGPTWTELAKVTIVGESVTDSTQLHAYRWTFATGMVDINNNTLFRASTARNISSDGKVIVGGATDINVGSLRTAFRWTSTGGMVSLGALPGNTNSEAYGVNSDGSVIVGGSESKAFIWTSTGGMSELVGLPGNTLAFANSCNSDGTLVVGYCTVSGNSTATLWVNGIAEELPAIGSGFDASRAIYISKNGIHITGTVKDHFVPRPWYAAKWDSKVLTNMGKLGTGSTTNANCCDETGNIVVGEFHNDVVTTFHPFKWTTSSGMVDIGGLSTPTNDTLAHACTTNGQIIIGSSRDSNNRDRAFYKIGDLSMVNMGVLASNPAAGGSYAYGICGVDL